MKYDYKCPQCGAKQVVECPMAEYSAAKDPICCGGSMIRDYAVHVTTYNQQKGKYNSSGESYAETSKLLRDGGEYVHD